MEKKRGKRQGGREGAGQRGEQHMELSHSDMIKIHHTRGLFMSVWRMDGGWMEDGWMMDGCKTQNG